MFSQNLFLCGSLCEGFSHHHLIKDAVTNSQKAQVIGSVYRLQVGYPVFCSQGEDVIEGALVCLKNTDIIWPLLDQFFMYKPEKADKSLFIRERLKIKTIECEQEAFVYGLNPVKKPKTAKKIVDGDWRSDLSSVTPLTKQLQVEEVTYIKKLGKCTGRDIIPYTPLTRELEKKGYVVDKGRRPALTKLGKEVFQFLV